MSAAAPWSVKGIEPRAREIAKDLARRSGMTLGEWLNTMILEDDEDGVVPLSSRRHAADSVERRGRARRLDDAYAYGYAGDADAPYHRLNASIEVLAERLEASERRATVAIQGVDQAVAGLVRRLEGQDAVAAAGERRADELADDLKEGQRRIRRFEQELGPQMAEAFKKMETSVAAVSSRLYDIEERQRNGLNELRQRVDAAEASPGAGSSRYLAETGARLDAAQAQTSDALRGLERSFADLDRRLREAEGRVEPQADRDAARFEKLAETLTRSVETNRTEMMRRLDVAETEGRISRVEQAVLSIGDQLKVSEQRAAQGIDAMGREVLRIAQNLNGRVQAVEADGARAAARVDEAIDRRLDQRLERDLGRVAQVLEQRVEQRLTAADDRHAIALEKLGGEITRISDRLSDRIAQSERRSAQALEEIGQRLVESSSRIEQRYDRSSGELAERLRQSEERTAQLLAEARESLTARAVRAPEPAPEPTRVYVEPDPVIEPIFATPSSIDWARAPFESEVAPFPGGGEALFDPEPTPSEDRPRPAAAVAERHADPVMTAPVIPDFDVEPLFEPVASPRSEPEAPVHSPFGSRQGFGGADVSDVLVATGAPEQPRQAPPAQDPRFDDSDEFGGETEFVDRNALKAAAAAGRASSTRQAIDAARAAMTAPADEAPAKAGRFGMKRGGKSKLQERLDKQAAKGGGVAGKIFGTSAVAVVATAIAVTGYMQVTGSDLGIPGLSLTGGEDAGIAAVAITPVAPSAATVAQGAQLYAQAVETLDSGDASGLQTLIEAGELGNGPAQLHLATLYSAGANGVGTDLVKSRAWAFRAAEGGDPRAMHFYGMLMFNGEGGARNRPEGLAWLKRAAMGGVVDSQYNVARIYENGDEGIAINLNEAFKWYLIAARGGDAEAESSARRVEGLIPTGQRQAARTQADAFQVAPLA